MGLPIRFTRLELAGALGDLGTLLPLAMAMVLVNGLDPAGLFFAVGLFYIATGLYFGVTTPVQPMKVIGAYAVAMGLTADQISASTLLMAVVMAIVGVSGAINHIGRWIPKATIRGVQLSTGVVLMVQGIKLILGSSDFQHLQGVAEPYLRLQEIGGLPLGMLLGAGGVLLTFLLIDNRRLPAGLVVVVAGVVSGVLLGTYAGWDELRIGVYPPHLLPHGLPGSVDFTFALFALVLPQLPMTIGNAVVADADLSREYFQEASRRVTYRALCISMAIGNFLSFLMGGMPLCHGAGGLAAHFRFGARTAGSNLMIGAFFIILVLFFGPHLLALVYLLPLAIMGVLLLFAGSQLCLTLLDVRERNDLFVATLILGVTLASNLAAGFLIGVLVAHGLSAKHLRI